MSGQQAEEEVDPSLERLFLQSYACTLYRDDAVASQLESGAHLRRVLTNNPSLNAQPLLLDRYDGRWTLDPSDYSHLPDGRDTGSDCGEWREDDDLNYIDDATLDSLRYRDAVEEDHSIERPWLGAYAPSDSYASSGQAGGGWLVDSSGNPLDGEANTGIYGRNARRPAGSEGGAAIGYHYGDDGDGGDGDSGHDDEEYVDWSGIDPEDAYDAFDVTYEVPEDASPPTRSLKQYVIMLGTAKTAQRSPQLEVLLKLKQADAPSFRFLSHHAALHGLYRHLKGWPQERLAEEYAHWQAVQMRRAREREADAAVADEGTGMMLTRSPHQPHFLLHCQCSVLETPSTLHCECAIFVTAADLSVALSTCAALRMQGPLRFAHLACSRCRMLRKHALGSSAPQLISRYYFRHSCDDRGLHTCACCSTSMSTACPRPRAACSACTYTHTYCLVDAPSSPAPSSAAACGNGLERPTAPAQADTCPPTEKHQRHYWSASRVQTQGGVRQNHHFSPCPPFSPLTICSAGRPIPPSQVWKRHFPG